MNARREEVVKVHPAGVTLPPQTAWGAAGPVDEGCLGPLEGIYPGDEQGFTENHLFW